ncbi:AraC family transcriptional regulator [Anaerocolumna jejuensis]|uniref:helix-turn-helix domain-containing protein n=1 Tax=Anaerocolumna jejuensis TaxID=259063 RepID=UPI003F7BBF93
MEISKIHDNLHSDIICEHKSDDYGGDFFHNHDGYELFLFLDGYINYYVEQQGKKMLRGDLICIKPYDFHRREFTKAVLYERIIINVRDTVMDTLSSAKTNLSSCFYRLPTGCINVLHLKEDEVDSFIQLAHQLNREMNSKEYGSDIQANSYIKQILVLVNRLSSSTKRTKHENIMPRMIQETMIFIEKHLTENISLDILSKEVHHNGIYISRRFKEITGISLQQYIIKKRITLAKSYLNEGYSPFDTCFLSGFNDYSNFSRTFSKQVGLPPKKYQLLDSRQKSFVTPS